jgi:hypothetical protein
LRWLLACAALLSGCAVLPHRGGPPPIFIDPIDLGGYRYPGDTLRAAATAALKAPAVELTITNTRTRASTSRVYATSELGQLEIPVDAAHLPGLDLQGASIQRFEFKFLVPGPGGSEMTTDINVVLDREALPEARIMLGKSAIVGATPPTDDKQELLLSNIQAWGAHDYAITSQLQSAADLGPLPFPEITPDIPLREYTVRGSFPKQIVQAHWSSTGEATVMTPKELRLVIAESIPARLLKLTAVPGP